MRHCILVFAACVLLPACGQQNPSTVMVDGQALPTKSLRDYRAEAAALVSEISVSEAKQLLDDESVLFVDIREGEEIARSGKIKGAIHVPRGYLEFMIDPRSPLHLDDFSAGKKVILYCETGGRSLLATKVAMEMGLADAVHIDGGFRAWTRADGAVTAAE